MSGWPATLHSDGVSALVRATVQNAQDARVEEALEALFALINHRLFQIAREALARKRRDVDARVLALQLVAEELKVAVALPSNAMGGVSTTAFEDEPVARDVHGALTSTSS